MKKTIFITIAEDIISRNLIFTDFWKEFYAENKDHKIVFLVQPDRLEYYKELFSSGSFVGTDIAVEQYKRSSASRFENMIMSLARSGINSHTNLWSKMRSYKRGHSSWIDTHTKRVIAFSLGGFSFYKNIIRRLILTWESDARLIELYDKYKPTVLFATSLTNYDFDVLIAREAKRRGIKIIGMVRSWDNLSSHGLLRVVPDIFILQDEFLKDMAIEYQAINTKNTPIHIVGLPHYDMLKDVTSLLPSREDFFKSVGLDPEKKLIFYGAMGEFLFIHEGELPEVFEHLVQEKKIKYPAQFLYRAHPKFRIDPEKIKSLKSVVFDTEGKYINTEKTDTSENENIHLAASIYYSDVVVTGASTIAIDAAVLDKPIVCIGFDGKTPLKDVDYWESVERFYDLYTHFEELMDANGVKLAKKQNDLAKYINEYIESPQLEAEGRKKIIERFVAPFDGKASVRLARLVSKEISKI
ncbi:MAG: CDP-glycerol glycerophosphotransferase family protein [Candidatus Paceibacterota bacterium]